MSKVIDGKHVSTIIRERIKKETADILANTGKKPMLAVIIVGEDPASLSYVRSKKKFAAEVGFDSETIQLPDTATEADILAHIDTFNQNPAVSGILVQLPLPKHIDEQKVISTIAVEKDVDGFHPEQVGGLSIGLNTLEPCTPAGIIELLHHYDIPVSGKHAVVIGRSNIVGKPIASLLLRLNATVTITHSRTAHLADITRQADILIVAIGKPHFLTADMVKTGAVVIDVGINRTEGGKLVGDVDDEGVFEKAAYLTPVPGGVGPMTIAMLLANTLKAFKRQSFA
ncbi:MAG: bifunctional methylenetetrahydrofolate dehydrogenase/methenyltetrahydrofolate cyclohydrolase FolD [Defluviitaleaceae bacterium]|nr:bifunctional methylenetetrahydrofolate dehydrogenase/methenyltetrahydrofolate cyclohydrolase FolD [Defluviitaleaceae bacterium]